MSPAHVLEPTYHRLKRDLITGTWRPGTRLEAGRLAEDLGVSMTPVRDCLNRLVGERLVDFRPGEGYRVARLSESLLRDLLDLNAMLLDHALQVEPVGPPPLKVRKDGGSHADALADLFEAIVRRTDSAALDETVRALSDRLHAVRLFEPRLLTSASGMLRKLAAQLNAGSPSLRTSLAAYHAECRSHAEHFVRLLEAGRA